jgi:hypothetical protein
MRRLVLATLALSQLTAPAAGAAEFIPSWDADVVWDSNVLRTGEDQESDFSLRTGPRLRVREPQGDLTYDLSYNLRYEAFARLNGINEFDHYATVRANWRATPTTQFSVADDFGFTSSLGGLFETLGAGVNAVTIVTPTRERLTTNFATASLTQQLGPLWQLSAEFSSELYNFKNELQSDTSAYSGTLQLMRGFTPRLVGGFGAQYQRQEFHEAGGSSGTSFYQGFGIVNYRVSPTFRLTAQAGPAWAQPDEGDSIDSITVASPALSVDEDGRVFTVDPFSCPRRADGVPILRAFPESDADRCSPQTAIVNGVRVPLLDEGGNPVRVRTTNRDVPFLGETSTGGSLNYFGRFTADKEWRHWRLNLGYSRSATNGSGFGTSTTVDAFSGRVTWTPTRDWLVELTGIYTTQSAVNEILQREIALRLGTTTVFANDGFFRIPVGIPFEVTTGDPIDNDFSVVSYRIELRAQRQISRNLIVDGLVSYWQQNTEGTQVSRSRQIYRVILGFTWTFDAIPL